MKKESLTKMVGFLNEKKLRICSSENKIKKFLPLNKFK